MTRKDLEIQYTKSLNRIEKQDDLLRKAVVELKRLEDENEGYKLSLESARMFATALMIATNTEYAEFTREELKDIVDNKMVGFSEILDDEGKIVGVKLELKVEVINETKEVADTENSGKRARKPRKTKTDRSKDTIQAGNDGLDGAPTDERKH